jgi:acyl-ACP dehydrogenase
MTDAAGLPYRKVGAGPLDTAAVHIGTWVPADALIARPGTGRAAIWPGSAAAPTKGSGNWWPRR